MNQQATVEKFETWGILEIMGHKKYAGKISERTIGNATFLQIDVPPVEETPAWSKMFQPSSVFAMTPTTEEFAKKYAAQLKEKPVFLYGQFVESKSPKDALQITGGIDDDDIPFEDDDCCGGCGDLYDDCQCNNYSHDPGL